MNFIYIAFIVLLLVVTTFLLLIFVPKPTVFFDISKICKELLLFNKDKYFEDIKEEILEFEQKEKPVNIKLFYNRGLDMKFKELPKTYEMFRTIPHLRSVQLSTLDAKTDTQIQKGDGKDVNDTLSAILPIRISGAKKNSLWCDGEIKFLEVGNWILYDASHEHSMSNKHKRLTTLYLYITIDRPLDIPRGIA